MAHRANAAVLNRLVGVLSIAALLGVVLFAFAYYRGDIGAGVRVTLRTASTGLLLDAQSKVSLNGVQVGSVHAVTQSGDEAVLTLDLDPDRARQLPANVVADLRPTTLFGAKYVALVLPADPAPAHLESGDVVLQRHGPHEADQVFQRVMTLLDSVQPEKVNAALTALSGALDGRGQQLGETVTNFDRYLVALLPSMPQFGRDLRAANAVLPTYQRAAPDLVRAMDHFRTTSATLVTERDQLGAVLSGVTVTGGEATALVVDAAPPLTGTVREFEPTAAQLARYSPMFTCLLQGLVKIPTINPPVPYPGLWSDAAFLPRAVPYRYPQDLPVVAEDSGPRCFGLPNMTRDSYVPHYNFRTGTSPFVDGVPAPKRIG